MLCSFIVDEDESFYRKIFLDFYCKKPVKTFDNIFVYFKEYNFDHAFFESKDRRKKDKSIFSQKRAKRIYWIKWVLENPNAQLFKGYDHKTKKYDSSRRVALCVDNYVVIIRINKKGDKAKLITSFVADGINKKGEKAIDLIKNAPKW